VNYLLFSFIFAFASSATLGQSVHFHCVINNQKLNLDSVYFFPSLSQYVKIESLKFYISQIELMSGNQSVWKEKDSYHLVDFENAKSTQFSLKPDEPVAFNALRFSIGIDSATNVSGALGGDLDPTKGMYWTWHSGYINFKLEGNFFQSPSLKKEFKYHIGGYSAPFSTIQTIDIKGLTEKNINIYFDLSAFISKLDLKSKPEIMSPGKPGADLAKSFSGIFKISHT
jgi:hypothetical protein